MKRFVASITASLAAALSSAMVTGPIYMRFGGISEVPRYWSGTNCKIEFSCGSEGIQLEPGGPSIIEPTITGYDVFIGGELTATWRKELRAPNAPSVSAQIVFDSTHFNNGTPLSIQVKVYTIENDVPGVKTADVPYERLVRNRFRMLTQKDFRLPLDRTQALKSDIVALLTAGKFTVSNRFNQTWTKDDLRIDLLDATTFSLVSHGNTNSPGTRWASNERPTGVENGPPPPDSTAAQWRFFAHFANADYYSVESARREGTQVLPGADPSTLPPYNFGNPPCTITYLGACFTGSDPTILQKYAWPLGTRYAPSPPDGEDDNEAVVAYLASPQHPGISEGEKAFWMQMMQGETVANSLEGIIGAYNNGITPELPYTEINAGSITYFGDGKAKAKGVYGGQGTYWWRKVQ